jgi:hypothetical protein
MTNSEQGAGERIATVEEGFEADQVVWNLIIGDKCPFGHYDKKVVDLIADTINAALQAKVAELEKALEKFGDHTQDCDASFFEAYDPDLGWKFKGNWFDMKPLCCCGFEEALRPSQSPTTGDRP